MNERRSGGRLRRWAATLSLTAVALTGVAGIGTYEIVQATKSSTSPSTSTSSGLSAGSGSSMTSSGGS